MNCEELTKHLDDYVDDQLDSQTAATLNTHVDGCPDCQQRLAHEQSLRKLLKDYGDMATADAAFFDAALVKAARVGQRQQQKRSWLTGFGSAVAAGLALWVVSTIWFTTATDEIVETPLPVIAMTVEQPRTVNLVFSSASALDEATLTVSLPDGVEIAGFEGQQEITWATSLREGKNLLPLQLIGTLPTSGVLMATLRSGDDDRTFRLRVDVS